MQGYYRLACVTAGITALLVAFAASQKAFGRRHDEFVEFWPFMFAFAFPVFVGIISVGRSWTGSFGPSLLKANSAMAAIVVVLCLLAILVGRLVYLNFDVSQRIVWERLLGFLILNALLWGAGYFAAMATRWTVAGFRNKK